MKLSLASFCSVICPKKKNYDDTRHITLVGIMFYVTFSSLHPFLVLGFSACSLENVMIVTKCESLRVFLHWYYIVASQKTTFRETLQYFYV